jgi:Mce-associated membrane protein
VLKRLASFGATRASDSAPPPRADQEDHGDRPSTDVAAERVVDAGGGPVNTTPGQQTTVGSGEADEEPSGQAPAIAAASQGSSSNKAVGLRAALVTGVFAVVALGGLAGWLGYRAYQAHLAAQQRELFVQVARQAAINLTTISYTHADADVARILDSATGTFHDDFQKRSQPFIDVVKQAQSTSQGTVTAAGLESIAGDQAQVIVAISVKTSSSGVPEQEPRGWRMRLNVQKVGDTAKVSNVQLVP